MVRGVCSGGGRGLPESGEEGADDFGFRRFGEDVLNTFGVGFLLPLPVTVGGVDQDGGIGEAAGDFFNDPDTGQLTLVGVEDAGIDEGFIEEGFGLLGIGAMDDTHLVGVDGLPHCIGSVGVGGQNQDCFHYSVARTRFSPRGFDVGSGFLGFWFLFSGPGLEHPRRIFVVPLLVVHEMWWFT